MALGKSIVNVFTGKLQKLFGKYFSRDNKPTLSANEDACVWHDADSNNTYLLF